MKRDLIDHALWIGFFTLLTGCMFTGVRDNEKAFVITIAGVAARGAAIGTPSLPGGSPPHPCGTSAALYLAG